MSCSLQYLKSFANDFQGTQRDGASLTSCRGLQGTEADEAERSIPSLTPYSMLVRRDGR
jgi:hypothetical protein